MKRVLRSAASVRLLALDFDGVLTDGTVLLGAGESRFKRVHYLDVTGITRWRRFGGIVTIVTGEDSDPARAFAAEYGVQAPYAGFPDKAGALREILQRFDVPTTAAVFMGDDVNDLPAMRYAAAGATVPGAHPAVLAAADWVSRRPAGRGAVRESVDVLLTARGIDVENLGEGSPGAQRRVFRDPSWSKP